MAKESFWYLDINAGTEIVEDNLAYHAGYKKRRLLTAVAANANVMIPFNRYSFFEELEDKLLVPLQLQFEIELSNADELIHRDHAAAAV